MGAGGILEPLEVQEILTPLNSDIAKPSSELNTEGALSNGLLAAMWLQQRGPRESLPIVAVIVAAILARFLFSGTPKSLI